MSSRRLLAAYEYDAFGQTQRATGPLARDLVFRFSTKWTDAEAGELDYGRRRYSPSLGRFTSRDPIEEKGGMNLYAFVRNNPVSRWDYLGMVEQMRWLRASTKDIVNQRWMWEDGDGFETDVVGQGVNLYAGLNPGLSQGSKTPGWMANNATPGAGAVADAQAHRIRRTLQGTTVVGVYTTDGQADAVRARKGDGTEYNIPLDPQSSTAGLLTKWVQSLSAPNNAGGRSTTQVVLGALGTAGSAVGRALTGVAVDNAVKVLPIGQSNQEFLADWIMGRMPSQVTYGPNSPQTTDMSQSPGADVMRAQFIAAGGQNVRVNYGTGQAFIDTIANPFTADWSSTAMQVGGFGGATVRDNGDGTVTFTVTNVAGTRSFFYHIVPNRSSPTGPMHNVTQTFIWTEPAPQPPPPPPSSSGSRGPGR